MRPRGRVLVAAAVLLVVVAVSLAVLAIVAPVFVLLELAVIALVAGLVSRRGQPSRRSGRGGSRPSQEEEGGTSPVTDRNLQSHSSGPPWVMQWQSLPPASAVPFVREQLARVLADWGLTAEAGEPVLLVVTELVTNALDHARGPIQLVVSFPGECVRVEVHDAATEPPQQQPRDPWAARGRGLQLVDALSARWGSLPDATGKTVWADVTIGWPG